MIIVDNKFILSNKSNKNTFSYHYLCSIWEQLKIVKTCYEFLLPDNYNYIKIVLPKDGVLREGEKNVFLDNSNTAGWKNVT